MATMNMKWSYVLHCVILFQAFALPINAAELTPQRMVSAFGDFRVGGLVPVHILVDDKTKCENAELMHIFIRSRDGTKLCYRINDSGAMWAEAIRFAVLQVNKDPEYNFTLGYDVRDSLNNVDVALDAAMDFMMTRRQPVTNHNQSTRECACRVNTTDPYVVTVIGGARSEISQRINHVFSIALLPQISYSSTSVSLSDKKAYRTFLRTIPPDNYLAKAMADIVKTYKWNYVATVATDEAYGRRGVTGFHEEADKHDICISKQMLFDRKTDQSQKQIKKIVEELIEDKLTNVVVLFCDRPSAIQVLEEAAKQGMTGKTFIATEDWGFSDKIYPINASVVGGTLGVVTFAPKLQLFTEHLKRLTPTTSSHNPWLMEWFNATGLQNAGTLHKNKASYVIDSVFTVAKALKKYLQCQRSGDRECPKQINLEKLREFMLALNFTGAASNAVVYDKEGNPEGKYQISNLQQGKNGNTFVHVGKWINGELSFDKDIEWNGRKNNPPVSNCSFPCPPGKYYVRGDVTCCWKCVLCPAGQYKVQPGNAKCDSCPTGYISDQNRTECLRIPEEFIRWDSVTSAILVSLSLFGILATSFMFGVYFKHRKSPIVKAASRYPSLLLLITIGFMFALPLLYIGRPNSAQCHAQPIAFGCLMALATSLVLTKTFRLIQIFNNVVANLRDKPLVTVKTQFFIVVTFLAIEIIIIAVFLDQRPLEIRTVIQDTAVPIDCGPSAKDLHIAVLLYNGLLAVICAIMAFRARSLPANFSEARLISFAMFTFSVIWLTILIAFSGRLVGNISTFICVAILATALDLLVCMFGPKIWVILFRPELNDMQVVRADIYRYTMKQRARSHTPQIENSESEFTRDRTDSQSESVMPRRSTLPDTSFQESKL